MVKYPQMKFAAAVLLALLVHASAQAGARVVVPSLPEPMRPLAEVETNVTFDAGMAGDNLWRLSIELDAAASNCVEVVFGTDADGDGELGVEEGDLCVGWDCGEWFWRDRRANVACRVVGSGPRLDWKLRLSTASTDPSVEAGLGREARSLASAAFPAVVAPTCFNPAWNMARVVSRGAETLRVESKVTVDALMLRIR